MAPALALAEAIDMPPRMTGTKAYPGYGLRLHCLSQRW